MSTTYLKVIRHKRCACMSGSSGPRLIIETKTEGYAVIVTTKYVTMACNACDTEWSEPQLLEAQ